MYKKVYVQDVTIIVSEVYSFLHFFGLFPFQFAPTHAQDVYGHLSNCCIFSFEIPLLNNVFCCLRCYNHLAHYGLLKVIVHNRTSLFATVFQPLFYIITRFEYFAAPFSMQMVYMFDILFSNRVSWFHVIIGTYLFQQFCTISCYHFTFTIILGLKCSMVWHFVDVVG